MAKSKKPDLLVLLDMHAILHRGFHALPDFETPDGQPTGALYGLYTMLLSIIDQLDPKYIVGCYDLPQPTKRHELFEDYKAGRKEVDPALIAQIKTSRDVLDSFGIKHFESPGFEADDLLGTIVHQLDLELQKNAVDVVIASGDHDTLQLVQKNQVQVYAMRRGIKDTVFYGEDEVKEKYGFEPTLLPDYKGLRGDPSDNIPGIAGIGEKTATTLIQEFGDLDSILRVAAETPEKLADVKIRRGLIAKLQDQADTARFSKELAIIRTDAPIEFELGEHDWRAQLDRQGLIQATDKLQFRTLKNRLLKIMKWDQVDQVAQTGTLFAAADDGESVEINQEDEAKLQECLLMVWLLNSDNTNPSVNDVERIAGTSDLQATHEKLRDLINDNDLAQVYDQIERPLLPVIDRMNDRGIVIDQKCLKNLETDYSGQLQKIEAQIYELAGTEFNVASPKQLSEILFDNLSLPKKGIKKTSTGNFSTAESELEKLRGTHEIIPLILSHRELSKLINTYISVLPKLTSDDGRLRATFVQWGTTTGRMSSRSPNLQNIPIRSELGSPIRQAFVAEGGKRLVAIDYSQIELRIAAWLSGDENLQKIFTSGQDIHASVAADMFDVEPSEVTKDMRSAAKTINFGILYGMGANALRANLNQGEGPEVTKRQASEYLDRYFDSFPGLAAYQRQVIAETRKHGYTTTHFGRRRHFASIKSKLPYLRAQAERMAVNAPIQGTQADIIKLAMVQVSDYLDKNDLRDDVHLLLQVHDELVFEIDADKIDEVVPEIISIMENVLLPTETDGVIMKAEAKVGDNWREMKSFHG